jgi:hypothetical protein
MTDVAFLFSPVRAKKNCWLPSRTFNRLPLKEMFPNKGPPCVTIVMYGVTELENLNFPDLQIALWPDVKTNSTSWLPVPAGV